MDHLSFVLVTIGLPGSAPGPPSFFKSIWFSSRPFRLGTTDFSFEMRSLSFIFALSVSVLIHGAPIRRAANSSDVTVLRGYSHIAFDGSTEEETVDQGSLMSWSSLKANSIARLFPHFRTQTSPPLVFQMRRSPSSSSLPFRVTKRRMCQYLR